MTLILGDQTIDGGINTLSTDCDKIFVCSQLPTTFDEATLVSGGYALGEKNFGAGSSFGDPEAGSTGRKVMSAAVTDGTITADGTVAAWAAVDTANSRLLAVGSLTGGSAVTAGQKWSLDSFGIRLPGGLMLSGSTAFMNFRSRAPSIVGTKYETAYAGLFNGLTDDGVFNNDGTSDYLDVLYILASNDTTVAKLNLVQDAYNATYYGTPAESSQFAADSGYTGDQSTVYLDTGFAPDTETGCHFQDEDCSYGTYQMNHRGTPQQWCALSAESSVAYGACFLVPYCPESEPHQYSILSGGNWYFHGVDDCYDLQCCSLDSGNIQIFEAGVSIWGPGAYSHQPNLPNKTFIVLAAYNMTNPKRWFSGDTVGLVFIGAATNVVPAGKTDLVLVAIRNRYLDYLTAIGV